MLFALSDFGDFAANIVVGAMAREIMQKPLGFEFRAVCENDSDFRERRRFVFVIGFGIHVGQAEIGAVGRNRLFRERIFFVVHKLSFILI